MSAHIPIIILTGGPCGGKTTILSDLQQRLAEHGVTVITVAEAATELILAGIKPGVLSPLDFQRQVFRYSVEKENRWKEAARLIPGDKKVIICDRGTADIFAYISPRDFARLLDEEEISIVELRDRRYDGVIFLRSVAFDAPEIYTCLNNEARRESVEEAKAVDERTLAAWTGHPHLRVIDNSTDLDGKKHRVFQTVCRMVGIPAPIEVERKYRIGSCDLSLLPDPVQEIEIVQHYLVSDGGSRERVRMRGQNGSYTYYHTVKREIGLGTRTETERQITHAQYIEFLERADPDRNPIEKTRFCFVWNNQYFELDAFGRNQDGLILLEVELTDINDKVELPDFLAEVATDVTGDPQFGNAELAKIR